MLVHYELVRLSIQINIGLGTWFCRMMTVIERTSRRVKSGTTECASECADGADLDQIKALLASVDPDLLMKLVKEIQNQKS
jgi:hypothetical protein